ncbi:MAG: hypothetical protein GX267_03665 [Fibrobacter sp.]|jgi:uncharacterized membrane protein YhhN|nr:hypothetical protein [Fibrobacter sp.]
MNGQKFYRFLQYSFISVAAFFLLFLSVLPHPVFVTLKITPAIIAIITVFFYGNPKKKFLPILIFFFMGAGDLFLGLSRTRFFTFALASFMVANILLLLYNIPYAGKSKPGMIKASAIVVFSIIIGFITLPGSNDFFIPVLIYLMMISAMAFVSAFNINHKGSLVYTGAVFFVLSDSLIAYDKFVRPVQGSLLVILILYYLALYCFCFGIVPSRNVASTKNNNL